MLFNIVFRLFLSNLTRLYKTTYFLVSVNTLLLRLFWLNCLGLRFLWLRLFRLMCLFLNFLNFCNLLCRSTLLCSIYFFCNWLLYIYSFFSTMMNLFNIVFSSTPIKFVIVKITHWLSPPRNVTQTKDYQVLLNHQSYHL